jgi:hypothetical protein
MRRGLQASALRQAALVSLSKGRERTNRPGQPIAASLFKFT